MRRWSCRSRFFLCPRHLRDGGTRRRDGQRVIVVCLNAERRRDRSVPVERKSISRQRRREAAVEAEVGEAAVRSDGFVFLHNGGAKRPQTVGLWGVFPSSARDVLPCKCSVTILWPTKMNVTVRALRALRVRARLSSLRALVFRSMLDAR